MKSFVVNTFGEPKIKEALIDLFEKATKVPQPSIRSCLDTRECPYLYFAFEGNPQNSLGVYHDVAVRTENYELVELNEAVQRLTELKPATCVQVELNDEYSAVIKKDYPFITVGCQDIHVRRVKELVTEMRRLGFDV